MTGSDNLYDNSWEAVWQREINELDDQLKRPEYYSEAEIRYKKYRKNQLEQALAERKNKNKKDAFKSGQDNVIKTANAHDALMAKMTADRAE